MVATILSPSECARLVPSLTVTRNTNVWVYHFEHATQPWVLAVATHAAPGSGQLSLGGFRIAPVERTSDPQFTPDREAIELAMGMEEKVHWSRVMGVGGPLAIRDLNRVVGGKCVLQPTPDSRVGSPRDAEMLEWAGACLREVEATAGIHITTGQDLGHGQMYGSTVSSLAFLHQRFRGSIVADTSIPTGEGNYQLLRGMLRAFELPLEGATVGLIGAGNIGMHIVKRLREHGTTMLVCERNPQRRHELEALGIRTWADTDKLAFVALPMDALVVNAAGKSLDRATVAACAANERLRVVCGSENLAMPDPSTVDVLRRAQKVYAPTELGGMMGYLTAVEEYLSLVEEESFDVRRMLVAARKLELGGFETTKRIRAGDFQETFEEAVAAVARSYPTGRFPTPLDGTQATR